MHTNQMNRDMEDFSHQIEIAKNNGVTEPIFIHASSGSTILYSMKTREPLIYSPYIRCIFNSSLDDKGI